MWKNFINWRTENDIDNVKVCDHNYFRHYNSHKQDFVFGEIDELKQFYPHSFFRTDKIVNMH